MFLDILDFKVENKKKYLGKTVSKRGLRNPLEELVWSPKIVVDFMVFIFLFLFFLHFFPKVVLWPHRPFFLKSETRFS